MRKVAIILWNYNPKLAMKEIAQNYVLGSFLLPFILCFSLAYKKQVAVAIYRVNFTIHLLTKIHKNANDLKNPFIDSCSIDLT